MSKNLVFMGTGPFALAALEGLYESLSPEDRLTVYTKENKKSGRGMKESVGCVAQFALDRNLPLYQPHSLRDPSEQERFLSLGADLAVVASYGLILPKIILEAPKFGCLCIHASLLPKYRGAAPIHRAILNGESETGITIMQMDEGIDTGDMLMRRKTEIGKTECVGELFDRLSQMGREMLLEILPSIYGDTLTPEKQDDSLSSYAAKITKEDQHLCFSESSDRVLDRIRAFSPVPCAVCITEKDGKNLKILSAEKAIGDFEGECGTVIAVKPRVLVKTADGAVALGILQPEGKGKITAQDAVNGRKIALGDRLI